MEIKEQNKGNYYVVSIVGRLDTTNYQELEEKLQSIHDEGHNNLIIDCGEMDYVSSSGLRVFLMFLKKIKSVNGKFLLCSLQDSIQEIFKISGFISIFDIYDDLGKAEEAAG